MVGLSALSIPLSFYNIENEEEVIIQMRDKNTLQYNIKVPPEYYDSVQSILGSIPTIIQEQKKYRKSEEKPLDHLLEEMLKVVILNKNVEEKMQNDDVRIQNEGDIQIDNERIILYTFITMKVEIKLLFIIDDFLIVNISLL